MQFHWLGQHSSVHFTQKWGGGEFAGIAVYRLDEPGAASPTHLFLSRMAPSLASFSAVSRDLTRSMVALNRFSSLGSSQRRSALSRTSCLPQYSRHVLLSKHAMIWYMNQLYATTQQMCLTFSVYPVIWYMHQLFATTQKMRLTFKAYYDLIHSLSLFLSDKHTLSLPFSVKLLHHKL